MNRPTRAALATGTLSTDTGVVVSPHHLASRAGVAMLEAGGTAADAAIAVNAVLAVVLPDTCGPGGDLFALVHAPGMDAPATLNASGRAGSGITADDLRDRGLGEIPYRSPWSITVPGCVDGWFALSDRFGALSVAAALEPAIEIAREGFPVSAELAATLTRIEPLVSGQGSAAPLYPDDRAADVDQVITRPALGRTLEEIAASGRDAFYLGPPGTGVMDASQGAVTTADLTVRQADWIEPAELDLFGMQAWTIPPNSQGYLTLATLWIFANLDPPSDPNDPLYQHLLIEAYRSVAWERADTVSDASTAATWMELLDADRLERRVARISRTEVTRWPMPDRSVGGTAYMTVRDAQGMGISFIQSNFAGIGSGLSAGSTGVWLHNRGAGFNLIQGHPNEFAPGKRPLHTLSPTLWTNDGDLTFLLGTRGGDQQPQYLAQYAAAHFQGGLCTDDAQSFPRWSMEQPEPGTDSAVQAESRFAPATLEGLRARGHLVDTTQPYEPGWGPISAIEVGRNLRGSADPRISTSAALAT